MDDKYKLWDTISNDVFSKLENNTIGFARYMDKDYKHRDEQIHVRRLTPELALSKPFEETLLYTNEKKFLDDVKIVKAMARGRMVKKVSDTQIEYVDTYDVGYANKSNLVTLRLINVIYDFKQRVLYDYVKEYLTKGYKDAYETHEEEFKSFLLKKYGKEAKFKGKRFMGNDCFKKYALKGGYCENNS